MAESNHTASAKTEKTVVINDVSFPFVFSRSAPINDRNKKWMDEEPKVTPTPPIDIQKIFGPLYSEVKEQRKIHTGAELLRSPKHL